MTTRVSSTDLVKLGNAIHSQRDDFLEILTHISTYRSAQDEINHVMETLQGAPVELKGLNDRIVDNLVVYLPPNVILFSYILYVAMPSPYCSHIHFRPSVRARDESYAIHQKIMSLVKLPANISYASRSVFWRNFTSKANVIVFTGRCQNALEIGQQVLPKQLLLYFGAGVNPFVVGNDYDLDIEKAVTDGIRIRLHNSGQDCLCPDLFLVHEEVSIKFIECLIENLKKTIYGDRTQLKTDYSNLSYPDVAEFCFEYLNSRRSEIIYGGKVNILDRYVEPTILLQQISEIKSLPEFFAPVFNIAIYKDQDQVGKLLRSRIYNYKAMGAMLYGAKSLVPFFSTRHMVTENQTLFEINRGNFPFGGWDKCASHVAYKEKITSKPLLISDAIREYLGQELGE